MAYFGELRHPYQRKVFRRVNRPSPELVKIVASTYTGFVIDRVGKHGAMNPAIKPLDNKMKICGPAVTVLGPELTLRRMAADLCEQDDVLVIAAGGTTDYACFGDGTARKMRSCGIQGVVVDGAVRDSARTVSLGFPCFCSATNMRNYDYPVSPSLGGINVPVVCGGVQVNPGDLILGDADGVLVVPKSFLPSLCETLESDFRAETEERLGVSDGFRFDVESSLKGWGYTFFDSAYDEEKN